MISVDDDLITKAKAMGVNVSAKAERALKEATATQIKDVSDEHLRFICSECGTICQYIFLCEYRNKVFCQECQDKYNMALCKHDDTGQHMHIRIPGLDGTNMEWAKNICSGNKLNEKGKVKFE